MSTELSDAELEGIEQRAQAALAKSPGLWRVEADMRRDLDINGHERGEEHCAGYNVTCESHEIVGCEGFYSDFGTEAAHVAGMSPKTTLLLVAEIRRSRARGQLATEAAE